VRRQGKPRREEIRKKTGATEKERRRADADRGEERKKREKLSGCVHKRKRSEGESTGQKKGLPAIAQRRGGAKAGTGKGKGSVVS